MEKTELIDERSKSFSVRHLNGILRVFQSLFFDSLRISVISKVAEHLSLPVT